MRKHTQKRPLYYCCYWFIDVSAAKSGRSKEFGIFQDVLETIKEKDSRAAGHMWSL
jgi:hypothetical protein